MPIQKVGTDTPIWLKSVATTSTALPGFSAEIMPTGKAMAKPTNSDTIANSKEGPTRPHSCGATSCPLSRLWPKSPLNDAAQPGGILHKEGPIQPQAFAQTRHRFIAGVWTQHNARGIARHNLHNHEDDKGDAQHDDQCGEQRCNTY